MLVIGGALAAVPLILSLLKRRVQHLYVSAWYLLAALIWFPMLFLTANIPNLFSGVEQGMLNWWYAHNVLGLWMTPLGLAAAYYMIPKIVGAPIYSYSLSLIGFWALALFYSQVGLHHLIGGPIPTWAVTISIVHSVMMVIPGGCGRRESSHDGGGALATAAVLADPALRHPRRDHVHAVVACRGPSRRCVPSMRSRISPTTPWRMRTSGCTVSIRSSCSARSILSCRD